jgi:predicted transglutaminase-like cysteine proteinase
MCQSARYVVAIAVFSTTTLGASEPHAVAAGENMLPPFGHTVFCRTYPADCKQSRSSKLFADTPTRHAELDAVNRHVNASIAPQAEEATSSIDEKWLLAPAEGNCSDYAVTKRHDLLQRGWSSSSLLLAEVTLETGEHHLILVADTEGGEFILDNLDPNVRSLAKTRSRYYWNRIESPADPKRWGSTTIGHEKMRKFREDFFLPG